MSETISGIPFPAPLAPMEAKHTERLPSGPWRFEPKFDGFRSIAFRGADEVVLTSRKERPFTRYFPELVEPIRAASASPCVIDGEIVRIGSGGLEFEVLQMRLHPAVSRVTKLAGEIPASFVAFDLLALGGRDLRDAPFSERRALLEETLAGAKPPVLVTPSTSDPDVALAWYTDFGWAGLDGVIAKRTDQPYKSGERAMLKLKHRATVDCVVMGFRWSSETTPDGPVQINAVGSLLLGLYDDDGELLHVGHTSSFSKADKAAMVDLLLPLATGDWDEGPPSRWAALRPLAKGMALKPELVCEVSIEGMRAGAFRHAARFERWRPDKPAAACTVAGAQASTGRPLAELFDTN